MHKKIILATLFVCLAACAHTEKKPAPSLYTNLGKSEGIDGLVVELIHVLAVDDRVKDRYRGVNMDKFRKGLSDYICHLAGGPCEYTGDSMQVVHAGHNYTNTEFNALVDDLIATMQHKKIPVATQNSLLAILAPAYGDVVYH